MKRLSGSIVALAALLSGCRQRSAAAPKALRGSPPVEQSDVSSRPAPPANRPRGAAPVIWIGLDGLDPDWMDRLSTAGVVPNWTRLVSEGADDKLASFLPILSPIVWTTEATGVGPDVHRVLDFEEIEPASGRRVPISGFSRAVPAVWNLASAANRSAGVVGWWATDPAEVVRGFFVSDRASPILVPTAAGGVAYPPALEDRVRAVTARDGAIGVADLRPYLHVPDAEISSGLASPEEMKNPIFALGRILASTRVTQRLSRDLYDRERPDLTAVYFEGPDEIGHVFASDVAPRLPCVSEADVARFGDAPIVYYRALDAILGQWMRRAAEDGATLLVTSDHGFKWGAERPCERSSSEWSTAAFWHRPDGVFAAWGKRVRAGRDAAHPSVFDVAPTVLALLGLPPDTRMTGRAVREAFRDLAPLPANRVFDAVSVNRVASAPVSAAEASENEKKLVALGYLSPESSRTDAAAGRGSNRPGMTEGAWNNLGLYERETRHDLPEAEKDFRKALEIRPGYHSPLFNLAILFREEKKDAEARDYLFRALAAGHADPSGTILSWAGEYRAARNAAGEIELLRRGRGAYPDDEPIARALADALFQQHDCAGARETLAPFAQTAREPETLNGLALDETCLGHRDAALDLFRRSLVMRPGQAGVIEALRVLGEGTR